MRKDAERNPGTTYRARNLALLPSTGGRDAATNELGFFLSAWGGFQSVTRDKLGFANRLLGLWGVTDAESVTLLKCR